MIKTDRMDSILDILREKNYASVEYLSEHVYASKVTIRRDLQKMEELGLVIRSYGGATICQKQAKSVPLTIREHTGSSEKQLIAKKAVALIHDGDTIYMDGSSTVLHMLDFLKEKQDITVITNSLRVAEGLCEKKIPVFCTGGMLVSDALVCAGSFAEHIIKFSTADMMFFSSMGISPDGLICDFSEAETHIRRLMFQHSKKHFFLCDSSKLGKSFLFTVCSSRDVDSIISDVDVYAWLRKQSEKPQNN